jgi:hypothetical protein
MNNAGGIVVGIALNDANGSLHYPSVNIGMMAGFTWFHISSVSCLISI